MSTVIKGSQDIHGRQSPQRSASATDSTGGRLEVRRRSLPQMPEDEDASRRSKSLDGDATIGNSALIARHLASKTRKSSLKKRQRHGKTETKSTSDHEDDGTCEVSTRDSPDKEADPGAKVSKIRTEASSEGTKTLVSKKQHQQHVKTSSASLESHANACDSPTSRRLTPVLTVTLPSTEELRHVPPIDRKPPPSPQSEDRLHKISSSSAPPSCDQPASPDDSSKWTSPPVHRRASKWTKVKKAFLTSSSTPGRREEEGAGRSNSVPSSPNRNSSFFDEVDELSSGEYGEIVSKNKHEDTYIDNTVVHKETSVHSTSIHAEIQKNYEELQQKLSQEFHKKLHEWERMKASSTSSSSCRGPAGDDGYHDKGFRRKMEEWERKHPQQNQGSNSKHRDSVAFQQLDEDNLSPDFRKKLQEWQRIKKTIPVDASGSAVPPQFRKKIAEWQLWRSGKTDGQHEWDRVKAASSSPRHSKGGSKKTGSGKCVEKYACKPQQKKEKEQLQWLEKELHKIEREKQRLEREREKLEKMRRAMGSGQSKQEVLIQTSTGFFRFQGISEKFTKRLYEWEKARGIGPEASTFALLDPGYRPAGEGATSRTAVTNVGTSSLSLNDVEVLEQAETAALEGKPHLRTTDAPEDDEPAAVIVDIEDVIEETAAPLPLTPVVQSETPVYSYAPEEVTRLIDSSGRKLETEIENLEGKIVDVAKTHKKELQRLRREETEVHSEGEQMCEEVDEGHDNQIEVLRARIRELERRQERLLREGETLQDSFAQHSEQQAALAQNLVGKMKQLQEANINIASCEQADPLPQIHQQVDVVSLVQDLSTQLLSLEPEVNSEKGVHTSILPRQSSEELSQLPSLLTNKVLELKEGLNYLCAASGAVALEQSKEMEAENEQVEEDIEPSTTYVLKFARKSDVDDNNEKEQAPKSGEQFPTVVQVDSEGNTSPVTCVTITPAFWKRRDTQECDQTSVLKPPESTLNREESSTCMRDSFCSAVSSASATSSVCDDEEEEEEEEEVEKDLDSYASDTEPQTNFPSLPKQIINDSTNKKDVSESSVIESEQEKNTDLEDDDDEDDEDDEGKNVGFKYKKAVSGAESYETEVQTYQGKGNGKQRKLLKTRRISDTHIRYRRSSDQKSSSITDSVRNNYESSNYTNENEIKHNSMAMENKQKRACHQPLEKSETEDCLVDNEIRQKRLLPADPHLPFSEGYSSIETDTAPCSSYSAHNKTFPSNPATSLPTPDNVFVKTTRKIFSPVRRDSKGKASSVISYVVSETTLSSGAEMQQYVQGNDLSTPLISPVVNVIKQEEREDTPINQSPGKTIGNMSPPAWMFTRKRSQSSSPALTRRKSSFANKSSSETISASDSNSDQSKTSTDSNSREELNKNRTPNVERKFNINTLKELELYEEKTVEELRNAAAKDSKSIEGKTLNLSMEQELKGGTSGENKTDKSESSLPPSRPITPSASFPPLPQSPNPNRRDLFKVMNKETAPSIRMMIAKYNQKLTEQDGPGGRSPEISGSGSASPVAWRSPVAERRVRAQMEKYQEEVRRVLEQDGKKLIRYGGSEVKKSASAGVIRAPESPSILKQYSDSVKNGIDAVTNKPPSILTKPRGILKSSSVGAIKTSPSVSQNIPSSNTVETVKETILEQDMSLPSITKPPSPRLATSPGPSSPSSPELGHHGSPPPSRLRALRLKKAKEEFLTRGPGGQSWTSEAGTPSTDTPSASVSPDPFWGQPSSPECDKEIRPILRVKQSESANASRLSQISVGSESSFDGSIAITGKTPVQSEDEGMLLVKSASAGMINVDESTYRKFYVESGTSDQPNASDIQENKTKSQPCGKFGISSITSRFRKVKMRKKDKEGGKMNAVSTLCRQSLLVDLHLSKGGTSRTGGGTEAPGPSTSKSCPSSPVLQRSSSGEKPGSGSSSAHTSWIFNPARKIFKPK
ncbi:hypothetical protein C0J52_26257 [Blattella germanica]|nr:hypothetical protein C0J52_26257 [Blattella germanica]